MVATATKEIPLLYCGAMIRRILAGHKWMTRRVLRFRRNWAGLTHNDLIASGFWKSVSGWQYGDEGLPQQYHVGNRLWIKETFARIPAERPAGYWTNPKWKHRECWYSADNDKPTWGPRNWTPSIFMPRALSRLTLKITDVRIERLQQITEADAEAEGVRDYDIPANGDNPRLVGYSSSDTGKLQITRVDAFKELWEELNKPRGFGWDVNPWVWVISFKRVE